VTDEQRAIPPRAQRMPRWVVPAVAIFWTGALATLAIRFLWSKLDSLIVLLAVSLFLSLAIEPGVNRLAQRGWRRGNATALIVFGVIVAVLGFLGAIGTLVGSQIADLLNNTEQYIRDTVRWLNDTFGFNIDPQQAIESFNDPDGPVQGFIDDQQGNALDLSVTALGWLLQMLSVMLFTFYLVADGPRLRRAICSRLSPDRQEQVLRTWELAATKTGGYLYSRGLLALLSALFHWVLFQSMGTAAPVALALWVGLVSQFLPVVGTYIAGVLPVLITFLDSPFKALIVLIAIIVYQQIENYLLSPRITARTMELHPAVAFGSALAGAAILGAVGAVLALPVAAMVQALLSELGARHQVVDNELTFVPTKRMRAWRPRPDGSPMWMVRRRSTPAGGPDASAAEDRDAP
jgi:predicted PurR-regulated permease PerM